MSNVWNKTDTPQTPGNFGHPEWPYERQVRTVAQLVTANLTVAGATTIKFTYAANVANVGVTGGLYVNLLSGASAVANLSSNGTPGLFFSNVTTTAVSSGNLVTLATATTGNIAAGSIIGFDSPIVRPTGEVSDTYYADTVLATDTRITDANNKIGGNINTGWVHVRKKTNADGSVRYLRETLVCLTDASSVNTAGGNTSWGRAFANT